jgi:NitT/TauT family transport system ATP-binding protein
VLRDIGVTYRARGQPVRAVERLDCSVYSGDFVSILGPSGCGKSTLIKVIAGLLPPSRGQAELDGRLVTAPRPDVGIVFQQPTLLPWRTVLGNVLVPARALRLDMAASEARARELISLVRLDGFERSYPHELSGGMQQRVALARALIHDPPVLVMDEPFAALDALTREKMGLELQRLWAHAGKTIIFVTHSIAEATFLSDRVLVLSERPARILQDIEIDLPRPRTLETLKTARFGEISGSLREHLYAASTDSA